MFVKIKEKLCVNMPTGAPQQLECVHKKQFKVKRFQAFYNAKCAFAQKQIPRQNEKGNLVSAKSFCVACKTPFSTFASAT